MIIKVDSFLDRVPGPRYNCFDFVGEVAGSYGRDLKEAFPWLGTQFDERQLAVKDMRTFKRIETPEDGCFVVFQRNRTVPHIGIWWKGRVLHLASHGAMYEPLRNVARRFPKVGFFV